MIRRRLLAIFSFLIFQKEIRHTYALALSVWVSKFVLIQRRVSCSTTMQFYQRNEYRLFLVSRRFAITRTMVCFSEVTN